MFQFKNCYFWRATFSWDPVSHMFPEALALLQQRNVFFGAGSPGSRTSTEKTIHGNGSYCFTSILHLAGECFNLSSLMNRTKVTLHTLPRVHPPQGDLEIGLLGRWSFKRGKPTLSCWHISQGQLEEFIKQSYKMVNTHLFPAIWRLTVCILQTPRLLLSNLSSQWHWNKSCSADAPSVRLRLYRSAGQAEFDHSTEENISNPFDLSDLRYR